MGYKSSKEWNSWLGIRDLLQMWEFTLTNRIGIPNKTIRTTCLWLNSYELKF